MKPLRDEINEAIKTKYEAQEKQINDKKKLIKDILPELELKRKLNQEPQEATIYKGMKGIKSIAEDVLKTKKEMLIFGAEGKFFDILSHYAVNWHKRRGKLKIPIKIIYNEKIRKKREKKNFPSTRMRFNENLEESPATTWIYGEKIAIVVWSDQPIATLIRSNEVAKSYQQFFGILWKNSKV